MRSPTELSPTEAWIAERSIRLFLVVAGLMLLGAAGILLILSNQESTQHQVDVLKPQVTKIVRAGNICDPASLTDHKRSKDCATLLRIALINCRRHPGCRVAFLATLRPPLRPSRGGGTQNPSPAGQPPGPGSHPGHSGHTPPQPPAEKPPKEQLPPPAPPPAPAPAPPAPPEPPVSSSPGNSGNTPGAGKGVKACVEIAVSACVKVGPGN
jgi:hypothetical protein